MNIQPFQLPLTPEQFVAALQKGQGRALLHVRQTGLGDFEPALIEACLHDQAYDPQCEGDRTPWVMQLVEASGAADRIADILLPQLGRETETYWDAQHRCRIALALARRGHPQARARLYSCLRPWPGGGEIGCEEIIALDGAEGLLHVSEFQGRLLQDDPTFWVNEYVLLFFDEQQQEEGAAWRILATAAEKRPLIAAYIDHLKEREKSKPGSIGDPVDGPGYLTDERRKSQQSANGYAAKMRAIPVSRVIEDIETGVSTGGQYFMAWGRHAAEQDLAAVLDAMMAQSEPGHLRIYLRVFSRRALPGFDPRLLRFADHEDENVRWAAYQALSNYCHPDVRVLALVRIRDGRLTEGELKLLELNYQPGDAALIEDALHTSEDLFAIHGMILDLTRVFQENRGPESRGAMLFIYEHSPCSMCRSDAVEVLDATGTMPDWVREERQHDCVEKIRSQASHSRPPGSTNRS